MKKAIVALALLICSLSLFAQGAKEGSGVSISPFKEDVDVRVVALKGPTAMGMVKMMDEGKYILFRGCSRCCCASACKGRGR